MNTIAQIFPRTGRISGPEAADGAKPDVPTTDLENEKKKNRVFYEAVDAHARRRLKTKIQSSRLSCKDNGKMRFTRTVNYIISNANYERENEQ